MDIYISLPEIMSFIILSLNFMQQARLFSEESVDGAHYQETSGHTLKRLVSAKPFSAY